MSLSADLAIIGGGLAGTCAALTGARAGLKVVLVQDRPVLGGNSSSEVRLWTLGATSHMGNNNRWAREGGVIDELLVENHYRNPEGNPHLWDALLLERVRAESGITLLLNTAVYEVEKSSPGRIARVTGFCSQNSTQYEVRAPFFCDASGDGVVGFLAGAAFRMGAESQTEFGEKFAPDAGYGELLGHSLYFYSKDTGRPVKYTPPAFALKDITRIPRWRQFSPAEFGCKLWWIEHGGRLDTVHETERIKWELWEVVYGVWHHIKNSGLFPGVENLTLEWVGTIPGKRESRRFEGDYWLRQQDIIEQRSFADVVSFGGWSIDLHPADGVFSPKKGCDQWHSRGVYGIPYRCLYSRNIDNLFLAGRIISATHVAFGSTRVMATAAHGAQAIALAAQRCLEAKVDPRGLLAEPHLRRLQTTLLRSGQFLPRVRRTDPDDLAQSATLSATSTLRFDGFAVRSGKRFLQNAWAQMLPLPAGRVPEFLFWAEANVSTILTVELRISSHPDNHTPDQTLAQVTIPLAPGASTPIALSFAVALDEPRYVFVTFLTNPDVALATTSERITGVLAVTRAVNAAVSNFGEQLPPTDRDIGVERFEFWCPERRPAGENFAFVVKPGLNLFPVENLTNGVARPTHATHAWVPRGDDPAPAVTLQWPEKKSIRRVILTFDCDYDHPVESVLRAHPEHAMPFCPQSWSLRDDTGQVQAGCDDQHLTRAEIDFATPLITDRLRLEIGRTPGGAPPGLFEIACFS